MRSHLIIVLMTVFSAVALTTEPAPESAAQELPPEIQVDRLLVQAEREIEDGEHWSAVFTFERILEVSEEHGLEIPAECWFRQAGVLQGAGLHERAAEASTRYLQEAGREGEHHRAALEILDAAEVGLAEARKAEARARAAAERAEREAADRAEAFARRPRRSAARAAPPRSAAAHPVRGRLGRRSTAPTARADTSAPLPRSTRLRPARARSGRLSAAAGWIQDEVSTRINGSFLATLRLEFLRRDQVGTGAGVLHQFGEAPSTVEFGDHAHHRLALCPRTCETDDIRQFSVWNINGRLHASTLTASWNMTTLKRYSEPGQAALRATTTGRPRSGPGSDPCFPVLGLPPGHVRARPETAGAGIGRWQGIGR